MKAAAVFHYNWPTEFEYIWRRKGNLGCSLCHEFCLSCRAEHKFCVSFLQCKLGVCGSTIICGEREASSWRGILLVLSFSINCNEAIGYGGQNHESRVSLFIALAFALNYRSLFRESDSLWHLSWLQWVVLVQRKWCRLFVPLLNALLQMSTQRVLLTIIRYRINIVASILFPIPFGYYGPSSFLGLKHMLRFDLSIVRLLRP